MARLPSLHRIITMVVVVVGIGMERKALPHLMATPASTDDRRRKGGKGQASGIGEREERKTPRGMRYDNWILLITTASSKVVVFVVVVACNPWGSRT